MGKRSANGLAVFCAAVMLMLSLTGCGTYKNIPAGSTWEVTEITDLGKLTIADGAVVKAPEGKSVTMTIAGVETPIKPINYKGKIVRTVTKS